MKPRRHSTKQAREVNAQLTDWSRKQTRVVLLMNSGMFDLTVAGRSRFRASRATTLRVLV
jgi:hypothetical protein